MEIAEKNFRYWLENVEEEAIKDELFSLENKKDEIEQRFGSDIQFGTAGLRGIMESGNNRINVYTVRKATQGLANYIKANEMKRLVAVSYDSRKNSKRFAQEVACVMAANGIEVYITRELAPTPFLSYMVRELEASAGVMITASHNTAEYNGYKCYGSDGAQMNETFASGVYEYIKQVDMFHDVKRLDFEGAFEQDLIHFVREDLKKRYTEEILKYHNGNIKLNDLKVVYTPLNGTGNKYVREVLGKAGVKELYVVPSQEKPDENFTTCRYPNPENLSAYDEALKVGRSCKTDIILATDPDADRLGVCVKEENGYRLLTGNEIGILLTNYILERKREAGTMPKNGVIIKTIVSTMMLDEIAKEYGCEVRNVLTGFKNIASEIADLENLGELERYLFGFEESNGYLCGGYVRDKDAVSASLLVCDAVAYYRAKYGNTLCEVLRGLYEKYGYFGNKTVSYDLGNLDIDVNTVMERFKSDSLESIGGYKLESKKDYSKLDGKLKSNVMEILTERGIKIVVRPSGTEPKLKVYIMVKGRNDAEKAKMLDFLKEGVSKVLGLE